MTIVALEARPVTIETRPEFSIVSAAGSHRASRYVLVRVRADDGTTGYGEASVMPEWSGETQAGARRAMTETLAPLLLHEEPCHFRAILDRMEQVLPDAPFTRAGVEMALLDLVGKIRCVPAYALLGDAKRPADLPLKFSIGAFPPREAGRVAETVAAMGFQAVKVKVGLDGREDEARVEAVRSALGSSFSIAVDANGGWKTEREACAMLPHMERLAVNMIEQPFPRGDLVNSSALRSHTTIPIALDESVFTPAQARRAIREHACDLLNIYPGKNGGMCRSLQIAEIAATAGVPCIIGSNLEWEIGSAAMLHLASVVPNLSSSVAHDIIGPLYHTRSVASSSAVIENGRARLTEGFGLGAQVEWERL